MIKVKKTTYVKRTITGKFNITLPVTKKRADPRHAVG
jgi:hypothetical protein